MRSFWGRWLIDTVALFIVFVFAVEAAMTVGGWWGDWQASRVDREDVFHYTSVEWSGQVNADGDLLMVSVAEWPGAPIDRVEWSDRLICDGGTTSHVEISAVDYSPRGAAPVVWPYPGRWPTDPDTECVMVSVIQATVEDRVFTQQLESQPFNPGDATQ